MGKMAAGGTGSCALFTTTTKGSWSCGSCRPENCGGEAMAGAFLRSFAVVGQQIGEGKMCSVSFL